MPLLAVPGYSGQPMTPELHRMLMQDKLEQLVAEAGEDEARAALEMSAEVAPAMWAIAENEPVSNWPIAILNSDPMTEQMHKINWSRETRGNPLPAAEIKEALREQTLASLLEML